MFLRFFILLCLFCSSLIFSQSEENDPDITTAELALYVVNAGSNDQTRFTLSSLDAPIYCNNSSGCMISVDGTNLTTGIYLVIVKDKNTHFTKKLMLVK